MKTGLIILMLMSQFIVSAQVVLTTDDLVVKFIDGAEIGQKRIERLSRSDSDLERFFHNYFYSKDLETYNQLYENPAEFKMSQDQFDTWQKHMRNANLYVNRGIIQFESNDILFAALPYYEAFDHYNQYHVKLAKFVNGNWVAMPTAEFRKYSSIKKLLTQVWPNYLISLINGQNTKRQLEENEWNDDNDNITLAKILSERDKKYVKHTASRSKKDDTYMSNIMWNKKGLSMFDQVFRPELKSYLSDLRISEIDQNEVIQLLMVGEQHRAYTLIEKLSPNDDVYLTDHVSFLKELFADVNK